MNPAALPARRYRLLPGSRNAATRPSSAGSADHATSLSGRRVVITGGTDGIGLHLARIMTCQGADLLIVGRQREDAVRANLMHRQHYVRADLSRPDSPALVSQAIDALGWQKIDILIHNAAAGWVGPVEEQSAASVDELISTNLLSPIILSQLLTPQLRMAGGKILFIGSVSADQPCPSFAVYSATKAALSGFARSLRSELKGEIDVQVIHPGPTRTAFHTKSGFRSPRLARFFMPPDVVANAIFRRIERKHATSTVSHGAWLTELFRRVRVRI